MNFSIEFGSISKRRPKRGSYTHMCLYIIFLHLALCFFALTHCALHYYRALCLVLMDGQMFWDQIHLSQQVLFFVMINSILNKRFKWCMSICIAYLTFSILCFAQKGNVDCGVFTCAVADCVSRSVPFNFNQADMPYFRKRLVVEIVSKSFLS